MTAPSSVARSGAVVYQRILVPTFMGLYITLSLIQTADEMGGRRVLWFPLKPVKREGALVRTWRILRRRGWVWKGLSASMSEMNNSESCSSGTYYFCCHSLALISQHEMRTFNGMKNCVSERLSNLPKVTQPWRDHLLGGGEWKVNWDLEDGRKDFRRFIRNALCS